MRKIAIIAAGGFGKRLDSHRPKSLLQFNGRTYLSILLDQISPLDFDGIFIFCNRSSFIKEVALISSNFGNTHVISDIGANSTYNLLKKAANLSPDSDYYFFYGHAPRPLKDIQRLTDFPIGRCVVSTYYKSSKSSKITRGERYIEPPYRINVSSQMIEKWENWSSFFEGIDCKVEEAFFNSPPEFNYQAEQIEYANFLKSWVIDLSNQSIREKQSYITV